MRSDLLRLPASKSRLVVLGKRLAKGTSTPADHELYVQVLDVYDRAQRAVRALLEDRDWSILGIDQTSVSGRPKTLDTLVQKLQRSPSTQLPYIRDIAGVRLVADMTLLEQDVMARAIAQMFDDETHPSAVVDRITKPASGYRARHVVVYIDDIPVEVQIRTRLQHLWAEMFERLADRFGRQIRYGEPPDPDPRPAAPGVWTRQEIVDNMVAISLGSIAGVEADASEISITRATYSQDSIIGQTVRKNSGLELDPAEAEERLIQTEERHRAIAERRRQLEEALLMMVQVLSEDADTSPGTTVEAP